MKRYIVIGLGSFGSSVAESLHARGHEVIALDIEETAVDRMSRHATRAVVGDGRNPGTLKRLGANGADAGVVSVGRRISASVLATMALQELGVEEIYVHATSRNHTRVLEKLGVTETIWPGRESGLRLAHRIASRRVLNYIDVGEGFGIQEMTIPSAWLGRRLRDLDLAGQFGITPIAIHDLQRNEMIPTPDPDASLGEGQTLLVAGPERSLERAADTR
jgi:trk system potassium uptake protein